MFLSEPIQVRFSEEYSEKIETMLNEYKELFTDRSHLIRCSIIELWRLHNNGELKRRNKEATDL